MSEPPWDKGQSPDQGEPPDQGRPSSWPGENQPWWPSGDQPAAWPSGNQPAAWPAGDQPSAWSPTGPPQDQPPSWPVPDQDQNQEPPPPSWPPGGQPPSPAPGFGYGYGPRPPRFARRPRFLGALIVLGLFIVFGFVVRHVTVSHDTVSVTTSPPGSEGPPTWPAPAGTIGSAFDVGDGKGNVYRVTLVKVIDPARGADQLISPGRGKRFVGLVFSVKAMTGSPQDEDANNDAVVVGNGRTYSAGFAAITGYTNFDHGAIRVAQGETVTGSVTFQLPKAVPVTRVRWTALSGFGSAVEWNVHG
jgi:hypothetical protein